MVSFVVPVAVALACIAAIVVTRPRPPRAA